MLVKLLILHEVRMRRIILSSVVFWKYYNFYALSPKRHDFLNQKNGCNEHEMYVLVSCTNFVCKISHSKQI